MLKIGGIATTLLTFTSVYSYNQNIQNQQFQSTHFKKRIQHINSCKNTPEYDIVIIGGGCTGSGVLLDACSRGYKTLLIESEDFSSGATSKSTKLIHGGVRYLQDVFAFNTSSLSSRYQKFRLVKQAIQQRSIMIQNSNYMNKILPIIIPCKNSFQSIYYYIGSVVYHSIYLFYCENKNITFNFPYFIHRNQLRKIFPHISDKYGSGIIYQDGQFNDAQMNINLLLTSTIPRTKPQANNALFQPGNIINQAQLIRFVKKQGKITGLIFKDKVSNEQIEIRCKYVVNCTGAWSDKIRKLDDPQIKNRIIPVAGSHMTYNPQLGSLKYGMCIPTSDGRILLVLPWLKKIIAGTTEKKYEEATHNPTITYQQKRFITQQILNSYDKLNIKQLQNLHTSSWTGMRPLVLADNAKDTKSVARTHVIQKSKSGLYSIMGGKWTIYRKMAEETVDEISKDMQKNYNKPFVKCQTKKLKLIGASSNQSLKALQEKLVQQFDPNYIRHLIECYGSLTNEIIKGNNQILDYQTFISKAEIDFIIKNQMVNSIEDVLLRRTRAAFLNNNSVKSSIVPYIAERMAKQFGWNEQRKLIEIYKFFNNFEKLQF